MTDSSHLPTGATHLSSDTFAQTLSDAAAKNMPVVVDFYADWCGPCQTAAPVIDSLADEYKDRVMIAKLNVDENNQTAAEYGVMSIPTVIVFAKKNEKMEEVDRQIGFPGEDGYRKMIERVVPSSTPHP